MRLVNLEPEWVFDFNLQTRGMRRADDVHDRVYAGVNPTDPSWPPLAELDVKNAQGVMFLCPVCFAKNGGPVGTESVLCWFRDRGVPDDAVPGPGRWTVSGTSFADLTLSPSINVDKGHWHGWIASGEVT